MSAREWKPGDVALVEGDVCMYLPERVWEHGDPKRFRHPRDAEARPLVVIDPEDAEQVERLRRAILGPLATAHNLGDFVAALREFANPTPPRPDEPMGLGAVVEDAQGVRWLRVNDGVLKFAWRPEGPRTHYGDNRYWASVDAVRVLSEGVPS